MRDVPEPSDKAWYRISVGISLAYFGQLMLGVFIGTRLFDLWHQPPPGMDPAAYVYASTTSLMAALLVLVFVATTIALRAALPMGIWKAMTHYARHLPPKKRFVRTLWFGVFVAAMSVYAGFVFARIQPEQAIPLTALFALLMVSLWLVDVRRAYRTWRTHEAVANGAA